MKSRNRIGVSCQSSPMLLPARKRQARSVVSAAFLIITLALAACQPVAPLPEGPQALQGVLHPASISRSHRGTHELLQNGVLVYYVESTTLNLRTYEDLSVTVKGTLVANTDPASPPVLIATAVEPDIQNEERQWDLVTLGVRFSAPKHWASRTEKDSTQFILSGSTMPILTVYRDTAEPLLPNAQPVLIQNMQAVRSVDEVTGAQTIAIRRAHETVIFLFTPRDLSPAKADLARQEFLRLLRSIQPLAPVSSAASSPGSPSSTASTASTALAQYCGGSAGVLCPSGQYCAITDTTLKTGVCKARLKK